MNATDYRQAYAAIMRCCAELRGIAARLEHRRRVGREVQAAALIGKMADMLQGLIASLQPFREMVDAPD